MVPHLSLGRVIDDMLAYVESIREPTGLVGWSGGAMWALAMAAQTDAVDAVAACEPVANSLMDEQERAALGEAVARAGEWSAGGEKARSELSRRSLSAHAVQTGGAGPDKGPDKGPTARPRSRRDPIRVQNRA